MSMMDNSDTRGRITKWAIALIIGGVILYTLIVSGPQGLKSFASGMIKNVFIIALIFTALFIVYKIFFEPKQVDLVANDKEDIIEAGSIAKPSNMRYLYFTGDKEHGESKIGTIVGYCQIQSYSGAKDGQIVNEDCFVFKKMIWPLNMFEQPKVLRVYPHEHSQLVGDIRVYAISAIKKFGYYFPNRAFLDVARIDDSVVKEAYRGQLHEVLKDMVSITRKASGMDSGHEKDLESRKLLKIPTEMGNREER